MGNLANSGASQFPSFASGSAPSFGLSSQGNSLSLGGNGFSTAGFMVPTNSSAAGFSPTSGVTGTTAGAGTTSQFAQLTQEIAILFRLASAQNPTMARNLVFDEIFLAVDTFTVFLSQEHGIFSPSFQNLPARENAINQNPLELTPVGSLLGSMVFEATAELLASTQPGAGVAV
jgi:hypothetical protein